MTIAKLRERVVRAAIQSCATTHWLGFHDDRCPKCRAELSLHRACAALARAEQTGKRRRRR